jgi:hypothetical protein
MLRMGCRILLLYAVKAARLAIALSIHAGAMPAFSSSMRLSTSTTPDRKD